MVFGVLWPSLREPRDQYEVSVTVSRPASLWPPSMVILDVSFVVLSAAFSFFFFTGLSGIGNHYCCDSLRFTLGLSPSHCHVGGPFLYTEVLG